MLNKKILVIPSWYPSKKNAIVGSFFREQAALMLDSGYDIKVLYGIYEAVENPKQRVKRMLPLFSWFKKDLSDTALTNEQEKEIELDDGFLLQAPIAYSFKIPVTHGTCEVAKLAQASELYLRALKVLMNNGWVPDLVHAQSSFDAGIFAHHISKALNIGFVIIEHQVFLLNQHSLHKQQLVLASLANADRVAVVSEHQKKCVLMNQPECNPEVIWNLVNEDNFHIVKSKHRKVFTIVTVSYPSPIKDYKTFFKAIKELSRMGSDFRYIIIGNSSFGNIVHANSDVFIEYSKQLGVYELGTFIPYLSREEIAIQLGGCDVFVCTSIAETFGVAAREAMMCGLPVVTTACGGIEDSINDETGLKVPIRDYKGIAEQLLKIKCGERKFDPYLIRRFASEQCGTLAFTNRMRKFYDLENIQIS